MVSHRAGPAVASAESTSQDATLVARVRAGDSAAFETIFRTYARALVRCAHVESGSLDEAEEIVQELFLGLWRRRTAWDPPRHLEAYLFAAVRNRVRNIRRNRHVEQQAHASVFAEITNEGGAITPATADGDLEASELAQTVRAALATLPPRAREIFLLNREWHLSYNEIATRLGVTVKAVEAAMTRALKTLRERIDVEGYVG